MKITIPIIITRSGAVQAGYCSCKGGDSEVEYDISHAYDFIESADYDSGCQVVHIEADIDIASFFNDHTVRAEVKPEPGGD